MPMRDRSNRPLQRSLVPDSIFSIWSMAKRHVQGAVDGIARVRQRACRMASIGRAWPFQTAVSLPLC